MMYKFKCKNGHEQEKEFSMKDKPLTIPCDKMDCPLEAETVIEGPVTFILKGKGWGIQ